MRYNSGAAVTRRPLLLFLSLALVFTATLPAAAGPLDAIFLTWEDCPVGGAGISDNAVACLSNDGDQHLFCGFELASGLDDVLGIEVVVDIQNSAAVLPDWWRFSGGACRDGAVRVSGDFALYSACSDPWQGLGSGVAIFYPGQPRGGISQTRIVGTFAVGSGSPRTLDAATPYYGLQLIISNARAVPPDACAGCNSGACLVLNSITLVRGAGATGGNRVLETPGAGSGNVATWLGGGGADCGAVPVRRTSWGRIRSLYR